MITVALARIALVKRSSRSRSEPNATTLIDLATATSTGVVLALAAVNARRRKIREHLLSAAAQTLDDTITLKK